MKRLVAMLSALSFAAAAAPWSSRWKVTAKTEAQDDYIVNLAASSSQAGWTGAPKWAISTAYALNAYVFAASSGFTYQATVAGTSASSGNGPACITGTCTDGTVTWKAVGAGTYPTATIGNGSVLTWRFPAVAIYADPSLAVTCQSTTPITPCAPSGDVQVDMQLVAGAAADALTLRTRWLVTGKYLNVNGIAQNYPFRLHLVPDPGGQGDPNVSAGALDLGGGTAAAAIDVVLQSSSVYAAVTIGTPVYVDFGACGTTCQNTL